MGGTPPIDMFIFNVQYVYIYIIYACVCAHVIVPPCLFLPSICCSLRLRCGWLPAHGKTLLFCKFLKSILFLATTDLHTCIYIYEPMKQTAFGQWSYYSALNEFWLFRCKRLNTERILTSNCTTVLRDGWCHCVKRKHEQFTEASNTMTAVIDLSLLLVEFPTCPC